MKPADVMQLIDLIADLESPAAADARAFADRALVQMQSPSLRIGVATDGGRPLSDLLSIVDRLGIHRDVWSLASSDRPVGVDAWVLVVLADQTDFDRERRFLERIGPGEKAVLVAGLEQAPGAKRGAIEHSFSGVPPEQVFFGAPDHARLEALLGTWSLDRDALRRGVIGSLAQPISLALGRDQANIDERLSRMIDPREAERSREGFRARAAAGEEALARAGQEVREEIRGEIGARWKEWVTLANANHGEEPKRSDLESSLATWLEEAFLSQFAARVERRVSSYAEHLPHLGRAVAAMSASQAIDFATPPIVLEEMPKRSWLRWLAPVAGGGIGYFRGGPKQALIGAALGFVVARLLAGNLGSPLEDGSLRDAVRDHVTTHLDAVTDRALAGFRTECALEIERLDEALRAAERSRPDRDRMIATLELIARARSLLS
jgi:hypothetical protein